MTLEEIFKDKSLKAKTKMKQIGECLISGEISIDDLMVFAENQNAKNEATCIEAIEYSTKQNIDHVGENLLNYATKTLARDEPRLKWESAKVIGIIAKKFPNRLNQSVENLLVNANNKGTVVRWASALALCEILKLQTRNNNELLPKITNLSMMEKDIGVKKKYLNALKKVKK